MITKRMVDQAYSDLKEICGGVREDYFGLLYLESEHAVPREKALNTIAFGGHDYGIDGFHFDEQRRNLYLFQFKFSDSAAQFKSSLVRLIEDGMNRIFTEPNKDDAKNQLLMQLRSCLLENRGIIDQVCLRFVFTGDPEEAERSLVLDKLREDLEDKKYLIDQFFGDRQVGLVVEFRSASGRVGAVRNPRVNSTFEIPVSAPVIAEGPNGEKMHIGFASLAGLGQMFQSIGPRFFDANIRYGLGESKAVNRAISKSLESIVLEKSDEPGVFAFNHNGITLSAERADFDDEMSRITAPRLLNGAQTVTTLAEFLKANKDNPALAAGRERLEAIRVLCKIITEADQKFITRVTVNNNRQNPVEPWNLRANDLIQLELQDKFRTDIKVYYERQENAFDQLSAEDLEDYGIREESKAIQMLKLTQTFLLTDGSISKLSEMRRVFEDDKTYDHVFRKSRLRADSRHILLCYKVQFRLRKLAREIEQKGQNKYWFISRARYLLWALLCQGLLNDDDLKAWAENHGASMVLPADYSEHLVWLATARVRPLLAELLEDRFYAPKVQEANLSFLRLRPRI